MSFQGVMFPRAWFDQVSVGQANELLEKWGHRMGPLDRPLSADCAYALVDRGEPLAVTVHSSLIQPRVGGDLSYLTRENTIELSRLCASRSGLCRVALRLWRELVFPELDSSVAISYQDADLHNGNTYRFDGWARAGYSHSGTDRRSGRPGRDKWIWVWPPSAVREQP